MLLRSKSFIFRSPLEKGAYRITQRNGNWFNLKIEWKPDKSWEYKEVDPSALDTAMWITLRRLYYRKAQGWSGVLILQYSNPYHTQAWWVLKEQGIKPTREDDSCAYFDL